MPRASGRVLIRGCGGLNCVIPKGMVQYSLPAPVRVTFLGNGVFVEVISGREDLLEEGGLWSNDWCPYRKRAVCSDTQGGRTM